MMLFWYLHRYGVSIAHFEKVNAVWCELFESVCVYIYIYIYIYIYAVSLLMPINEAATPLKPQHFQFFKN